MPVLPVEPEVLAAPLLPPVELLALPLVLVELELPTVVVEVEVPDVVLVAVELVDEWVVVLVPVVELVVPVAPAPLLL